MAILPFTIQLSYAGTPAGTITYNAGTDTITVIGANSTHPAEFLDLYNADVAGGWNQITMLGDSFFAITCRIYIGNDVNATYFSDTLKEIYFYNSAATNYDIFVSTGARLTLGTLANETLKTSKNGCLIKTSTMLGHIIYGSANSEVKLYSSTLMQNASNNVAKIVLRGNVSRIWNTRMEGGCYLYNSLNSDFYNVGISESVSYAIDTCTGTFERMWLTGSGRTFALRDSSLTFRNCYVRGYTNSLFYMINSNVDHYFIDLDLDRWVTAWYGTNAGEVYRQYSFNLYILNGALTDFVENANVTLTHDGAVFGSWLTNSTGQIDVQTLTYGFYNQTGSDTMYGGTAWTLTITHPDWTTYTSVFYPYSKIEWSISMQDTSTADNNMVTIGLLLSGVAFLGIIVIRRKTT